MRGAPCSGCAARTAGSEAVGSIGETSALSEDEMRALRVGCEGRLGRVGEGSRSRPFWSSMAPLVLMVLPFDVLLVRYE